METYPDDERESQKSSSTDCSVHVIRSKMDMVVYVVVVVESMVASMGDSSADVNTLDDADDGDLQSKTPGGTCSD